MAPPVSAFSPIDRGRPSPRPPASRRQEFSWPLERKRGRPLSRRCHVVLEQDREAGVRAGPRPSQPPRTRAAAPRRPSSRTGRALRRAARASGSPPAPREEPAAPRGNHLRLGRGVRLEGKLTFSGTVRIDATFQGSIVADGVLVVGEDTKVDADITCASVVIEGE